MDTLVPEVFLYFSPHERAVREPRSDENESRRGEKEKPLVTLDLDLTFMQRPAVKRVKLIITKGTNGDSASTCLSAANFLKQGRPRKLFVYSGGEEWYHLMTYLNACLRECFPPGKILRKPH